MENPLRGVWLIEYGPLRQRGEGPDHGRGQPPADGDAEGTGQAAAGDDAGLDRGSRRFLDAGLVPLAGSGAEAAVNGWLGALNGSLA